MIKLIFELREIKSILRGGSVSVLKSVYIYFIYYKMYLLLFVLLKEYLADMGPGALIELHQHMVRSPPPTTRPRIPIFKYDEKDQTQVILYF